VWGTVENSYVVISKPSVHAIATNKPAAASLSTVYYVLNTGGSVSHGTPQGTKLNSLEELIAQPSGITEENGWKVLDLENGNEFILPQQESNPYYGKLPSEG